jgi:hypothetical protein
MRDAQADVPSAEWLRAQLAFKDSMVHGILQFTPSIAFRYVLHRCESRDIRCRESFFHRSFDAPTAAAPDRPGPRDAVEFHSPWRNPRRCLGSRRLAPSRRPFEGEGEAHSGTEGGRAGPAPRGLVNGFAGPSAVQVSTMILPQVHLRKPCYDFSFL